MTTSVVETIIFAGFKKSDSKGWRLAIDPLSKIKTQKDIVGSYFISKFGRPVSVYHNR